MILECDKWTNEQFMCAEKGVVLINQTSNWAILGRKHFRPIRVRLPPGHT
jgi:hypothetical protein